MTSWTLAGLTIASLLGVMASPPSASEQPQPVKSMIASESSMLPLLAIKFSEAQRQSPPDDLGVPLRSPDHEIRRTGYLHRWDQAWFYKLVVEIVQRRCGEELATLHPRVQQAHANAIASQVATTFSPEVQHGMGHPNWIKTREEQVAAATKSPAEWQAQLGDRLAPVLPSGENWAVDVADPTLNVLYTAAKFDFINGLEPVPSQFPAVDGLSCGQSTPRPAPQNTAPRDAVPDDAVPKGGPLRIALSDAGGAIVFHHAAPRPRR